MMLPSDQDASGRTFGEEEIAYVTEALRSVRVQHPDPEVAEVSAHLVIGKRSAAMAFRLEALGDRWSCTALELGTRMERRYAPAKTRGGCG